MLDVILSVIYAQAIAEAVEVGILDVSLEEDDEQTEVDQPPPTC